MKLTFSNILLGGTLLVTVGLVGALWRLDPRLSPTKASATSEAGHSVASSSGLEHPELKPSAQESLRKKELSVLPIGRHTREDDLEAMELPKRVQVFHERQNEFMRERMAELLAQDQH